jgi:hypothetical protein
LATVEGLALDDPPSAAAGAAGGAIDLVSGSGPSEPAGVPAQSFFRRPSSVRQQEVVDPLDLGLLRLRQRALRFERGIVGIDLLREGVRQGLLDLVVHVELALLVELLALLLQQRDAGVRALHQDSPLVERTLACLVVLRLVGEALHQVAVAPDRVVHGLGRDLVGDVLLLLGGALVIGKAWRKDPLQRSSGSARAARC